MSAITREGNRRFGRIAFHWSAVVFALLLIFFLVKDFYPPSTIPLTSFQVTGMSGDRADNLIVQDFDSDGSLWASRGMWAYKKAPEAPVFRRQFRVPTGWTPHWFRNFQFVRTLTRRHESIEMLVPVNGRVVAMAAGKLWYRAGEGADFIETTSLEHYGIGDPGIRHNGIIRLTNGTLLLGEYFRNPERGPVRILKSEDAGRTWGIAWEFGTGEVRHIHGIQQDPVSGDVFILTGDNDAEAGIFITDEAVTSLFKLGAGKQRYRATQIAFTSEAIVWGADTTQRANTESGVYRYDRLTRALEKLLHVDGAVFYANKLASGVVVLTTNREGGSNEVDDLTRVILVEGKDVRVLEFGQWKWTGKYAKLRLPRTAEAPYLAMTVLNHVQFDNDLLLVRTFDE